MSRPLAEIEAHRRKRRHPVGADADPVAGQRRSNVGRHRTRAARRLEGPEGQAIERGVPRRSAQRGDDGVIRRDAEADFSRALLRPRLRLAGGLVIRAEHVGTGPARRVVGCARRRERRRDGRRRRPSDTRAPTPWSSRRRRAAGSRRSASPPASADRARCGENRRAAGARGRRGRSPRRPRGVRPRREARRAAFVAQAALVSRAPVRGAARTPRRGRPARPRVAWRRRRAHRTTDRSAAPRAAPAAQAVSVRARWAPPAAPALRPPRPVAGQVRGPAASVGAARRHCHPRRIDPEALPVRFRAGRARSAPVAVPVWAELRGARRRREARAARRGGAARRTSPAPPRFAVDVSRTPATCSVLRTAAGGGRLLGFRAPGRPSSSINDGRTAEALPRRNWPRALSRPARRRPSARDRRRGGGRRARRPSRTCAPGASSRRWFRRR